MLEDDIDGFWRFRTEQPGPDNPFFNWNAFYGGGYSPWGFAAGHSIFNPIYMFEVAMPGFTNIASKEYTSNQYLADYLEAPYHFSDIYFSNNQEAISIEDEIHILTQYAPILYQNTRNDKTFGHQYYRSADYPIAVDFDGDWSSKNNAQNCINEGNEEGEAVDLKGTVYGTLVATKSHYFLGYHVYHALDDAVLSVDRHDNDMENIYLVVARNGIEHSTDGEVVAMLTNKHGNDMLYSEKYSGKHGSFLIEKDSHGVKRATVYISSNGDGADFGHGIESWRGEGEHPFIQELVRYNPSTTGTVPIIEDGLTDATYHIISMRDPDRGLWQFREQTGDDYMPLGGENNGFYDKGNVPWISRDGKLLLHPSDSFAEHFSGLGEVLDPAYTYNDYAKEMR